ncbi:hypothetical protein COC42_10765 [Sphingomonas spermidinifaciens]|uniref:Uncharacterized protein n=1 Tax=Sphingomonas spermidinifaciens TaxID=1141889 RepID=A0A2A4B0L8_9SPHN|nr:hypothetical protein [Sphingomonas spermidinifaciens]PCD01971.1 hypothetical protein COC42_10765 [Sphingomonas spermidinifaciens]
MEPLRPTLRAATVIRIHCPIAADTLAQLLAGRIEAIDHDVQAAHMLATIRDHPALGDFGIYRSVIELAPGWEAFTPAADAQPTLGMPGQPQRSPTLILTLYVPAGTPDHTLDRALNALIAAHPWEVPVIEVSPTQLLLRA